MIILWVRLWHDFDFNPKWRMIARASNHTISEVMAVYSIMLITASKSTERGRITGWSDEVVATALDLEPKDVEEIRGAMQGRVLDGDLLSGWKIRQPEREDGSAERGWKHREKLKALSSQRANDDPPGGSLANASERNRTLTNATERNRTLTNAQSKKKIKNKKKIDISKKTHGTQIDDTEDADQALSDAADVSSPAKHLADALTTVGKRAGPLNPHLVAAAAEGVTAEEILSVVAEYPDMPVSYIAKTAQTQHAAKTKAASYVSTSGTPVIANKRQREGPMPLANQEDQATSTRLFLKTQFDAGQISAEEYKDSIARLDASVRARHLNGVRTALAI